MPGTMHVLDRIPQETTATGVTTGHIPMVQGDGRVAWGPAVGDQVEGYVPRVQVDGTVDWQYPLGTPAGAIASLPEDGSATSAQLATAINALKAVLEAKWVIAT